jgi:transglutaminase-like putative cysteine protease
MSVAAPPRPAAPPPAPAPPPASRLELWRPSPLAIRLVAVLAVALYAFDRWLVFVEEPPNGVLATTILASAALGAALLSLGRLPGHALRVGAAVAAIVGALAAVLLAAGVPSTLLDPRSWQALASGIGDGIGALPGLTVPYRGANEWARHVLVLGGSLLVVGAVVAATAPPRGSRTVAALLLCVLFAIPAVQVTDDHPWRAGAVFAIGMAAVLYAERLAPRRLPLALATVAAAVLVGLAAGPAIDRDEPILDVQELATQLQEERGLRFSWDHSYGRLDWPRDGREVLRVRSRIGAYWKAETLDVFDGVRWVTNDRTGGVPTAPEEVHHPEWVQRIRVVIGGIQTEQFIGAGTTTYIWESPRKPIAGTAGNFVSATSPLRNGHAYRARVYYPRPSAAQLRGAGDNYPSEVTRAVSMVVAGSPSSAVYFPPGTGGAEPMTIDPRSGLLNPDGRTALENSAYARVFRLAQRLRARAATPYDYVLAVQRHLASRDFVYDELPPQRTIPLVSFLFDDKRGYCQQFSGAMAVLLRMGGVPSRVAAGFSPGVLDRDRGEYVVRDVDAHSWVEVFFPDIGWVTFDPTPQIAPPRTQLDISGPQLPDLGEGGGNGSDGAAGAGDAPPAATATGDGGSNAWPIAFGTILALGVAAAAGWMLLDARRFPATSPELAELERALRRAHRAPQGGTTLLALERSLGDHDDAANYLRTVRRARYAGAAAGRPSGAERRALRRVLGHGLGLRGRLRALYALPPRLDGWPLSRRRARAVD